MTDTQIQILDELIEKGYVTRTSKLLNGQIEVVMNSVTTADQLTVESELRVTDSVPVHLIHNYSVKLLSRVLKSFKYKDKFQSFTTPAEAEKFVLARPNFIIDALIKEHSALEKEISALITPEKLEENFSVTPAIG